ncbi:MAG: DUF2889 domain-containing protein [Actinobacteria bacterium]|nr:DUF2889 domain-containing protein [Actinomycetota bacterium]
MFSNKLFPVDANYPLIHTRQYQVQAFRMSDERFLLRGAIVDEKPAGLYIESDPDPIWMHHMIVELQIVYPTFLIEKASVEFKNHPHLGCTNITDHYKKARRHVDRARFQCQGSRTFWQFARLHAHRCVACGDGASGDSNWLVDAGWHSDGERRFGAVGARFARAAR